MSGLLMERLHFVKGLDPVADAFAGTVNSDVVSMRDMSRLLFLVHTGAGATGRSTFTVEAVSDAAGANPVAIEYVSREILADDTEGPITKQPAAGYAAAAGASKILLFEIREDALSASGRGYVRLHAVESVDAAVLGSILVIGESNVPGSAKPSAIV